MAHGRLHDDLEIHLLGRSLGGDFKGELALVVSSPGQQFLAGFGVYDQDFALTHRVVGDKFALRVDGVTLGEGEDQHPVGQGRGRESPQDQEQQEPLNPEDRQQSLTQQIFRHRCPPTSPGGLF